MARPLCVRNVAAQGGSSALQTSVSARPSCNGRDIDERMTTGSAEGWDARNIQGGLGKPVTEGVTIARSAESRKAPREQVTSNMTSGRRHGSRGTAATESRREGTAIALG
ncbi:hypothetical protein FB451DRAFT_1165032 [Mycena latifolia]|nr:hypothetical protein FB451DRAFT_1165032 [Mycena latifolia]